MYLFGSQARGNARADIPHLIKVQLTEHRKIIFRILFRLLPLLKVQPTEHHKNSVPYLVPATAPHKGATHGTPQK